MRDLWCVPVQLLVLTIEAGVVMFQRRLELVASH